MSDRARKILSWTEAVVCGGLGVVLYLIHGRVSQWVQAAVLILEVLFLLASGLERLLLRRTGASAACYGLLLTAAALAAGAALRILRLIGTPLCMSLLTAAVICAAAALVCNLRDRENREEEER